MNSSPAIWTMANRCGRLGTPARYSSSGHVIFEGVGAGSGIWAMSFGGKSLDSFGEPFPIADSGSRASVSDDGTLVYIDAAPPGPRQLVWRDREGSCCLR